MKIEFSALTELLKRATQRRCGVKQIKLTRDQIYGILVSTVYALEDMHAGNVRNQMEMAECLGVPEATWSPQEVKRRRADLYADNLSISFPTHREAIHEIALRYDSPCWDDLDAMASELATLITGEEWQPPEA